MSNGTQPNNGTATASLTQQDIAEIDKETKEEMEKYDDQVEQQVEAEYGSDEDSYTMLDA